MNNLFIHLSNGRYLNLGFVIMAVDYPEGNNIPDYNEAFMDLELIDKRTVRVGGADYRMVLDKLLKGE